MSTTPALDGIAFAGAATRYWLLVFPRVCRALAALRARAAEIPDPVLRGLALQALDERGNIEGAAAFAAFVPHARRRAATRALVAFQAAYNYLDLVGEQPGADPVGNGRSLHEALLVAVDPAAEHVNYYEHCVWHADGGYLAALVEECREALAALPSYAAVADSMRSVAARIADFQSLHLSRAQGGHEGLERWARALTPPDCGLSWWETAASCGSSLGIFALIALAAEPQLRDGDGDAVEAAYFPWIGALHSLLDNLVDRREDAQRGQRSLVDYYASSADAATRMTHLAVAARSAAGALHARGLGRRHTLVLAAMASYYLSTPDASESDAAAIARGVLRALGGPARLASAVFALRRRLGPRGGGAPGGGVPRYSATAIAEQPVSVAWQGGWGRVL